MTAADRSAGEPPSTGTDPALDPTVDLEQVRGPRADLHAAMVALEQAVAGPMAGRKAEWAMRVHDALVDLGAAFERHIAVTEGPDGLLERVRGAAPRLSRHADRLADEHRDLRQRITEALDAARTASSTGDDDAQQVSEHAETLLISLTRHRHAGADLIYEAYEVDIGAGD